jgi:hypothetical protein
MSDIDDMTIEERDEEIERLFKLGEGQTGVEKSCPMCSARFTPRSLNDVTWDDFHLNTCSTECQGRYNTRIFALDGGRSIVTIKDLSPETAASLLGEVGLGVVGSRKVMQS